MLLERRYLQMRVKASAEALLLYAVFALWFARVAETLDVTIFSNPTNVFVTENVSLECKFTGSTAFSLTNVGVQWFGPSRKEIYTFDGSKHTSKRQGAKIFEAGLRKGDASLFLPNIQIEDEGNYTCIVFVTPLKAEKSSELQVSAEPEVHLSTDHITVQNGTERSVSCNVKGFYPNQLDVIWEKETTKGIEELKDHFCTGALISMDNRTFSVSSRVWIEPTLKDNGNVYRCIVKHRSCPKDIIRTTRLTVKEPEKDSSVGAVVGSIIGAFVVCGTVLFIAWFFWRTIKVPPEIIEMKPSSVIHHLEENFINYQVYGFKPSKIRVVLILKRRENGNGKEILDWNSTDGYNINNVQSMCRNNEDEGRLLINCCEEDKSFSPSEPTLSCNSNRTFKLEGTVKVCPDVKSDNGAELILQVYHDTVSQPKSKAITLDVKAVPPKISNIVVPLHIYHNEPAALICSIIGFKPKSLQITWQQIRKDNNVELVRWHQDRTIFATNNGNKPKYHHQISEVEYEDKSYGITSVLVILPDILRDQETRYICEVKHNDSDTIKQKDTFLQITARPKLDRIVCDVEKPVAGECMTLQCQIRSFYPPGITITWLKQGEKVTENFEQSEPTLGIDGLYHLTTSVKSTLSRTDVGKKYTCQVSHESLAQPLEVDWVVDQLILAPKLTEVTVDPVHPEVGKPVTLFCKAYDFYPKDNEIFWLKGFEKTEGGIEMGDIVFDGSSGSYSRWSKRTFTPTYVDHGKEFKMQILHTGTSNKPVSSSHVLTIFGMPYVEDIKLDPPEAKYGSYLTMTCRITNFLPQDIDAAWQQNGNRVVKGITVKGPVKEKDGCFSVTSQLRIIPTAVNFNQEFSFQVCHIKLKAPVIKRTVLILPALSPTLSSINVDPNSPEVNQKLTLSVTLTKYAPAAVKVRWFKNKTPCSEVINQPAEIAEDGLFSSVTSTEFVVTEKDHKCVISCEVSHPATKEVQEKTYWLFLKGIENEESPYSNLPKDEGVSQITCKTPHPQAGQPVTMSCTVTGSALEDSHITWYKDIYPLDETNCIKNKSFETGVGFTTALTYTPKQEDDNCHFQVDIITEMDPISRYFTLKLT
uniref:Natural killer cell cytotoxicity receptor 3 ligand (B7H6) n=1 Tax=Ginglymostoma cirratum TaxID=7801 RepID=A0A8A9WSM4_GINCI|nr:natural killer cell cytotoxicity receptor 3 ligand (B7H6) [Ginglymostoma cirratum]